MGARNPLLRVVQLSTNQETIETLAALLQDAKSGKITGIVYAAMHRQEGYSADVIGRARSFPIMALGILHILQERLSQLL